jgi:glycine betaine/choline ABC-type transport system substrate-binding protein
VLSMRLPPRAVVPILIVLAVLGPSACGDDDGGDEPRAPSNSRIERDPANAGRQITVGSKNFAEQYVLGEIYAQALEAAGFDVRKELDLGAEKVAYRALRRGRIDAYPEYTGTALTVFFGLETSEVPRDRDAAFARVEEELAREGIVAMPPTPFQNTFVVTSTTETADALGDPETLSELSEQAGSRSISAFPECRTRPDCLVGLRTAYGWTPRFVASEGKFEDLDQGQADFTFGFGTDGELGLDRYVTYDDDKRLFPPYHVTFMVRREAAARLGDAGRRVIEAVQRPLTEELMRELNGRVTLDGQEPESVARDYLREQGFV